MMTVSTPLAKRVMAVFSPWSTIHRRAGGASTKELFGEASSDNDGSKGSKFRHGSKKKVKVSIALLTTKKSKGPHFGSGESLRNDFCQITMSANDDEDDM